MLFSAAAELMASLAHAAPYREPRKYEARYRGNDDACERRSHRSCTTLEADYPPVRRIVEHVAILCQSDEHMGDGFGQSSDIFDVFDSFQIMPEVTILLRTNVRTGSHRLPAHGASWPAGGHNRG